ncbi:ABC transporter ATP-binding protein [Bordetella sp. FB-8]|uniref:ABC transporter ATP-binding protein n=1 Tax=Bordetella sp. FB-8 TaxID=1159870 RepID=UPI0003696D69|nr:ATP-binding cassette domain-containing protein [Bordetella sp. FB-8]
MSAIASLEFDDIIAGYRDTTVLRGISGRIGPGQVLGVVGRNGVGKTTLMHTLAGFITPFSGRIAFSGEPLDGLTPHQRHARGISYAPQDRVVFDDLSVADNLTIGWPTRNLARYRHTFERFPRIAQRLRQKAGRLSGGEKKLLSFVRAIGENALLTLMDEPTEGVAQENIALTARTITERKAQGAAFVIVEQNLDFLLSLADILLVLDHGSIVASGPTAEFDRPRVEQYLVV